MEIKEVRERTGLTLTVTEGKRVESKFGQVISQGNSRTIETKIRIKTIVLELKNTSSHHAKCGAPIRVMKGNKKVGYINPEFVELDPGEETVAEVDMRYAKGFTYYLNRFYAEFDGSGEGVQFDMDIKIGSSGPAKNPYRWVLWAIIAIILLAAFGG